jgi:hypothetical protein
MATLFSQQSAAYAGMRNLHTAIFSWIISASLQIRPLLIMRYGLYQRPSYPALTIFHAELLVLSDTGEPPNKQTITFPSDLQLSSLAE